MKTPLSVLACLAVLSLLTAAYARPHALLLAQEQAAPPAEDPHVKMLKGLMISEEESTLLFPSAPSESVGCSASAFPTSSWRSR